MRGWGVKVIPHTGPSPGQGLSGGSRPPTRTAAGDDDLGFMATDRGSGQAKTATTGGLPSPTP